MQQLEIEHKKEKLSANKLVGNSSEELENKREGHGKNIALTRHVYRLQNTDTFYVESESGKNIYYYVKYNFSGFEWCSCPDNSTRGMKCKHQFAIEYSIRLGTLKDIDKLPIEAKRYPTRPIILSQPSDTTTIGVGKSYRNDDYSF
jgi:hypothetical protein